MSDAEQFDKLSEAFNTTFEKTPEEALKEMKNELATIESKKNELESNVSNTSLVLQNQEFLRNELKSLIVDAKFVMVKLKEEIKTGAPTGKHEAYAKLLDSITKTFTELRELDSKIVELKMQQGAPDNNVLNKKVTVTLDQLLTMVDKAKASSQINAVDANFTVDEKEDLK